MRHPRFAFLALLPAALALLATGCGNKVITSICRQTCDCSPCTKADMDTCVTLGETAQTKAQTKNCTDEYDKLLTCLDDNLSCQEGAGAGTDKCSTQEQVLNTCAGIGNPFTTPCAEAAQKSAMCNGVSVQPGQTQCPAGSACQSLCILAQPCDVLSGQTFSQEFQDCINQCSNVLPPGSSTGVGGF
jgi:hypothetical protein